MTENFDIQDAEDRISDETFEGDISNATVEDPQPEGTPADEEEKPDTFPREYVEKLRDENAKYRQRAQRSDELAARLHTALVASTGRLQDPSDLEFNEEHLDDEASLEASIDDLLERKPHLASRKIQGDIGQGATTTTQSVDLAGLLRARA